MFELRQVRLVILVPGRYKGLPCTLETEDPSNCLSSIWTPKTWPFYSLCFPCFSPVPISFCSASNSLHPSELREGWCVFNFLNTTQKQKFMCLPQKEISLCLYFLFTSIDAIFVYLCHTFNVHENANSLCQNAWLSNRWCMFTSLRWGGRDNICICLRVYLHGHPLSPTLSLSVFLLSFSHN